MYDPLSALLSCAATTTSPVPSSHSPLALRLPLLLPHKVHFPLLLCRLSLPWFWSCHFTQPLLAL
jgi:hypothetical protein